MTKAAREFLESFRTLPLDDQRAVLLALLSEPLEVSYSAPSDVEILGVAEQVFLAYDKDEAG